MNAKDYYINENSFSMMSKGYRELFSFVNKFSVQDFYQEEFSIGEKIRNYYIRPICEQEIIFEMFKFENK